MALEFDIRELTKKLSDLENKVSNTITKKALQEGAEPVEKALKVASPVDTGELKRNIKASSRVNSKKGRKTINIGVSAKDGVKREVVEKGYYNHYGSRSRAGTYWMNEGFKKSIEPAKNKIKEVLIKELK